MIYLCVTLTMLLSCLLASGKQHAELRLPLDGKPSLSANFGELRPNHFHSGLDFKTGGETGRKVRAVADGYVSGVEVSPWGYGRAVYITHPSLGIVTVYGHLMSFAPGIDEAVRDAQYKAEAFEIEIEWSPDKFPVKAGDVIGLSGNAGSSGGPHLHFNVEDAETGDPMDPLPYFKSHFTDTEAPYYKSLYLYPDFNKGIVNGKYMPSAISRDEPEKVFTAWGRVTPAIKCNDSMNGSSNIFGVKTIVLYVDGRPVMGRTIDRFPYSATRAINTLVDYERLLGGGGWAEWSRIPMTRPLSSLMGATLDNGIITIDRERDYKCRYVIMDEFGNKSVVNFIIRGRRPSTKPVYKPSGTRVRPGSFNTFHVPGGILQVNRDALWDVTEIGFKSSDGGTASGLASGIFTVTAGWQPFAKSLKMVLLLPDSISDNQRAHVVRLGSDGERWSVGGVVANGVITADISRPGKYAVAIDNTPPAIRESEKMDVAGGNLAWIVTDSGSGLESYRLEINGQFVPAELDGKNSLVKFRIEMSRIKPAEAYHAILTATDAVGNKTTTEVTFAADGNGYRRVDA